MRAVVPVRFVLAILGVALMLLHPAGICQASSNMAPSHPCCPKPLPRPGAPNPCCGFLIYQPGAPASSYIPPQVPGAFVEAVRLVAPLAKDHAVTDSFHPVSPPRDALHKIHLLLI
jgi:hypothetical protein